MLYRRNLVRFGPAREMFNSEIPVVRQFLSGSTDGPIGMSEEKDSTKPGQGPDAQSTSGMTAKETEKLEREAGAPDDSSEAAATSGSGNGRRKKSL
jgi:phospholipid/cholesterol/gamma-HCH transport system ATP-binding protein